MRALLIAAVLLLAGAPAVTNGDTRAIDILATGVPVSATSPAVAVVGDSITAWNLGDAEHGLKAAGVPSWRISAQAGRRMAQPVNYPTDTLDSGTQVITAMKSAGIDPALWVIELGTNDISFIAQCGCADQAAYAGSMIASVLAAIGPNHHVVWVNVRNEWQPMAAVLFNQVLASIAATNPNLTVVDWWSASAAHPEWLTDQVHPSAAGAPPFFAAIGAATAGALPRWVVPPYSTSPTFPEPATTAASAGVATASAVGQRLQTPTAPVGGTTIEDRCGRVAAIVTYGSPASDVRSVECALREWGLDPGPDDGVFDEETEQAVLTLQAHQALVPWDGGAVGSLSAHMLGLDDYATGSPHPPFGTPAAS